MKITITLIILLATFQPVEATENHPYCLKTGPGTESCFPSISDLVQWDCSQVQGLRDEAYRECAGLPEKRPALQGRPVVIYVPQAQPWAPQATIWAIPATPAPKTYDFSNMTPPPSAWASTPESRAIEDLRRQQFLQDPPLLTAGGEQ